MTEPYVAETQTSRMVLRAYIVRIERLEADKDEIAGEIKEVYEEARGSGFDPAIMRKLVARRKKDPDRVNEEDELLKTYEAAVLSGKEVDTE